MLTKSVSLTWLFCLTAYSQSYLQYVNPEFVLMIDSSRSYHSWSDANVACQESVGTQLGTFFNFDPDILSYRQLTSLHGLSQVPCWVGAYQTDKLDDTVAAWAWIDGSAFNLTSAHYDFNDVKHRCGYFYPFLNVSAGSEINDWYCNNETLEIRDPSSNYHTVAYCWVCNKPKRYNYSLLLTTDSGVNDGSNKAFWFKIQGNIENTTYENETWTEWFNVDSFFNEADTTYTWIQELTYVGDAIKLIILTQESDGLRVSQAGVNDEMFDFDSDPAWIKYSTGPSGDGCSYIIVNFETNTYSDFTDDYTSEGSICPYHNSLPTTEPSPYPTYLPTEATLQPSFIPTNVPSIPTRNPIVTPTKYPTYPTISPTNYPTILPTVPTIAPSNIPSVPTIEPTRLPTSEPIIETTMISTTTSLSSNENEESNFGFFGSDSIGFVIIGASVIGLCFIFLVGVYCVVCRSKRQAEMNAAEGDLELELQAPPETKSKKKKENKKKNKKEKRGKKNMDSFGQTPMGPDDDDNNGEYGNGNEMGEMDAQTQFEVTAKLEPQHGYTDSTNMNNHNHNHNNSNINTYMAMGAASPSSMSTAAPMNAMNGIPSFVNHNSYNQVPIPASTAIPNNNNSGNSSNNGIVTPTPGGVDDDAALSAVIALSDMQDTPGNDNINDNKKNNNNTQHIVNNVSIGVNTINNVGIEEDDDSESSDSMAAMQQIRSQMTNNQQNVSMNDTKNEQLVEEHGDDEKDDILQNDAEFINTPGIGGSQGYAD